ncbi:TPA: PTS glucitol/sorbitol transporter subunit IIB [Staphylococcus aureus]|uniref:PTS glucitol/sorbitol transporter subunit IIB n=1 Tax=Staphylococcus TaxID=1279 RepID=UPI001B2109A1|nr:PTS glucitol/sorbitol transporter subunit IIB [Staphylococcus haemolyticus]HAZ5464575.1 PTS glucitol/sorbitol transporter subunit IIB [Staphylococcus aureus]MDO0962898.1 PTS glucitol/sorbitol transporter subunit IIB [Staphylococcus haemolyticus]MDO0965238.1 PTS glucitol/sorbitol transporter subunit IIB [Staphylococcus haemolyticus]WLD84547.1 PTS glucitol/sorbitol transporter subunit IIB [Staphylococcus haemolyticus]HAZ5489753.1 PTS glucitol/sorbitol transporter subunit IIB [Staphylococcus a
MNNTVKINKGPGGFGGPLTIKVNGDKNKLVYITGGHKPKIVDKIAEITGAEVVNGFETSVPEEEIMAVIIDCGGTLRCGIYPKKGIPTINIMATGKSGPLRQYITEDIYVSNVGINQVFKKDSEEVMNNTSDKTQNIKDVSEENTNNTSKYSKDKKIMETRAEEENKSLLTKIGLAAGKVINTFYQAARDAVDVMLHTVIPFMGFVALLIGIIQGSGIGNLFAKIMSPLAGNIWGLLAIGFICSLPFLSPLLGPGGVIGQVLGTLIGVEIGKGNIPPHLALPALFAINTQNAADFIPVGLGLAEADTKTIEVGVPSVLYSRFLNGVPRVFVAWLASFGLYK